MNFEYILSDKFISKGNFAFYERKILQKMRAMSPNVIHPLLQK